MQHAVDDRAQASDGPLDHFGYDAKARFDDGIAVIVQIDVEDIDRQHVARLAPSMAIGPVVGLVRGKRSR